MNLARALILSILILSLCCHFSTVATAELVSHIGGVNTTNNEFTLPSVKCLLCETAVEALRELYEGNITREVILHAAVHVCEHYANNDTLVCRGLVSQFRDSFLYVLSELVFRPSQLCGLILPDCGHFMNPFDSNWTIPLPPKINFSKKSLKFVKHLKFSAAAKRIEAAGKINPIFPHVGSLNSELQVLQLSDLHCDPLYEAGSEADCAHPICCQPAAKRDDDKNDKRQLAGYWGSVAKCDLPYRTIINMLQHINSSHKIDYVLLTGDLMSHSDWTYTKAEHQDVIRRINATLNEHLPGVPVFWTIGNHEGVPVNTFAPHFAPARFRPDWLYQEVVSAGRRWIPEAQLPLARYRGSYAVRLTDRLKLITINSGYCETTNFFLYINQTDPDGTLSWLVDELYDCELAGWDAHITAHIPPGDAECLEGWARNYYRIVNRFTNTIKAQFFGHVHTDSFTVFYEQMNDYNSTPTGVLYSAPSVTTFEYLNPAYRIYTVDGASNEVTDFRTYFLNISTIENLPRWELLYSAKEEYGLSDLSPASWNELVKRIYANHTVYQQFLRNYARRDDFECDHACGVELLCALRRGHHNDSALCDAATLSAEAIAVARAKSGITKMNTLLLSDAAKPSTRQARKKLNDERQAHALLRSQQFPQSRRSQFTAKRQFLRALRRVFVTKLYDWIVRGT